MIAVDTNIIIRLLTHDDEQQYKKVYAVFNRHDVFIAETVILEIEWILRYAYKFLPNQICDALVSLFGLENVYLTSPGLVAQAIEWHRQGLDFSDALHLAKCRQCEKFYTFDKGFVSGAK